MLSIMLKTTDGKVLLSGGLDTGELVAFVVRFTLQSLMTKWLSSQRIHSDNKPQATARIKSIVKETKVS